MHSRLFVLAFLSAVLLKGTTLSASDVPSSEKPHSPEKTKQSASTSKPHLQRSPRIIIPPHRDRNLAIQKSFGKLNDKIEKARIESEERKAKIESEKRKNESKLRKSDSDIEKKFKRLQISKD